MFSPKHQERLKEIVPEIGQVTNPVDLGDVGEDSRGRGYYA